MENKSGHEIQLVDSETKVRVSSVWNKDTKQFGKQFMFDGKEDTCWNSHQGSPQFIILDFGTKVRVDKVCIVFQGGFAGKTFEVKDESTKQSPVINKLQILFKNSTDFYGRVTIYKLEIFGQKLED